MLAPLKSALRTLGAFLPQRQRVRPLGLSTVLWWSEQAGRVLLGPLALSLPSSMRPHQTQG